MVYIEAKKCLDIDISIKHIGRLNNKLGYKVKDIRQYKRRIYEIIIFNNIIICHNIIWL